MKYSGDINQNPKMLFYKKNVSQKITMLLLVEFLELNFSAFGME